MHKKGYFLAALVWTSSILLLCLEPATELPKIEINNVDKIVHFGFHFVFIILWFLYLNSNRKIVSIKIPIILFSISLVFGIGIEISQQVFTTSRKADLLDVIANISGASSALVFLLYIQYFFKYKK